MRFFRNAKDLSAWVKQQGAKQASMILINLPKVGTEHGADVVETSKRIVEASDDNAADVLFGILKAAGVVEEDVRKVEEGIENVKAANELLANKVIESDEHAKMVKQASLNRDPAVYDMPLRVCPKLPWSVGKKLISTYNCRHYCIDGVVLDDDPMRVYCGELLWRRHVADKFSSDFQDRKTGELVGGYINDRFYKFPDAGTPANKDVPRNGGNPMMLKPGERSRIPRPHQWSAERRMQEAREKNSTSDITIGKTASGWVGRMVKAQVQITDRTSHETAQGYITKIVNGVEFELEWVMSDSPAGNGMSEVSFEWPEGSMNMIDSGTSDGSVLNPTTGEVMIDGLERENLESQWEKEVLDAVFGGKTTASVKITRKTAEDFSHEQSDEQFNPEEANLDTPVEQRKGMIGEKGTCPVCGNPCEIIGFEDDGGLIGKCQGGPIAESFTVAQWKSPEADKLVVEAKKKKGKPVNPWAVCHTTVDKDKDPEKYEKCVMDVKKEHPVKESSSAVARKVIFAAGRDNFVKISSKVVEATEGDGNVVKAFSMAIDLHNGGTSKEDAAIKVAEATGMTIANAVGIQTLALKKMATHVSDAYSFSTPEKDDEPKSGKPKTKPADEVEKDATELGI